MHRDRPDVVARRSFLAALAPLAALVGRRRAPAEWEPAGRGGPPLADTWDLSWLNQLRGKHRQVFDLSNMEVGLAVVRNWFDAHQAVYGLRYPDLNAVIGIGGRAFPINASDDLYRKFPIGDLWKVNDPGTGRPAERNVFLEGGQTPQAREATVRALQARGAIFWQCDNALRQNVAVRIAEAVKRPSEEVYAELKASLNAGVKLVPAHTMLLGLAQEQGCAYESL